MHIGLFVDAKLPPERYGGTERVVLWLGRALIELGHKVTYFANSGSRVDFAEVRPSRGGRDQTDPSCPQTCRSCIITAAWFRKIRICRSARRSMATRASR